MHYYVHPHCGVTVASINPADEHIYVGLQYCTSTATAAPTTYLYLIVKAWGTPA